MKKKSLLLVCFLLFSGQFLYAQSFHLWGMTPTGGLHNGGVIFKVDAGGTGFDTVYSFNPDTSVGGGNNPQGDLFKASSGKLYGTAFYGGKKADGTIFSYDPSSNTYTDVHDFNVATGFQSEGSVIETKGAKLYGMTGAGGTHDYGVIFSFNIANNTYADVHDFDSTSGSYPYGNLLLATNGKLYGMTQFGGTNNLGIIFSFDTSNNTISDLYDFDGTNGQWPYGSLIQSGNKLFGLTSNGGLNSEGAIFSYDISNSAFTKLYDFNIDSGGGPSGNLTRVANGIFYGTTSGGGVNGDGVIFSFDTSTNKYSDLSDFDGTNGEFSNATLILGSDNNLYGMAPFGGADSSYGTIFSFDPSNSNCLDEHDFDRVKGKNPSGNLIQISSTGIEQLATANYQLSIYPNPASEQMTVITNQALVKEIRIENILGQRVLEQKVAANYGQLLKETLDVSSLTNGVYFISIISDNNALTSKVVIANK